MGRRLIGVCLAVVMMVVLVQAAHGQDVVTLRLALARDDVLSYAFSVTFNQSMQIGPMHSTIESRAEGREIHRVVDADADGTVLIDVSYEDVTMTVNGNTARPAWPSERLRVQLDGTVVAAPPSTNWESGYPLPLPPGPTSVGTSWTRPLEVSAEGLVVQGTGTFTLTAIEQTGNGRVARIRTETEGRIVGADFGPLSSVAEIEAVQGGVSSHGETIWSVDRGRVLSSTEQGEFQLAASVTAQGEQVRLEFRAQMLQHRELSQPSEGALSPQRWGPAGDGETTPMEQAPDPAEAPAIPTAPGKDAW